MPPLFSESEPTSDGFYWWKADDLDISRPVPVLFRVCAFPGESTILRLGNSYEEEAYGLFGPQIPLPIAQPVHNLHIYVEDGSCCEGVFIPTRRTMVPC